MKTNNIDRESLLCHYSDLPSPMAYVDCADYDSMGNHGRFPQKNKLKMKKISVKKIAFLISLLVQKFKRKRKSIWDL
jgi:hypothetical protein